MWLRNFDLALTHLIYKYIHHSKLRTTIYKYLTFYYFSLIGYINRILGSWIKSSTIATLFSTFSIPFSTSRFPKFFLIEGICAHICYDRRRVGGGREQGHRPSWGGVGTRSRAGFDTFSIHCICVQSFITFHFHTLKQFLKFGCCSRLFLFHWNQNYLTVRKRTKLNRLIQLK